MSVTYCVALPFVKTEDGIAAGEAKECQSAPEANRTAKVMSRNPANVGTLSFMRTGDPSLGSFADTTILKTFGDVPENLDQLYPPSRLRQEVTIWRTCEKRLEALSRKRPGSNVGPLFWP